MSNDPEFFNRYSESLNLFNKQMQDSGLPGHNIAASAAYAAARYAIWATANTTISPGDLETRRQHAIDTFTQGYRDMLEEHFNDFVANYNSYYQHKPGAITR